MTELSEIVDTNVKKEAVTIDKLLADLEFNIDAFSNEELIQIRDLLKNSSNQHERVREIIEKIDDRLDVLQQLSSQERITISKKAPKFFELLTDLQGRNIKISNRNSLSGREISEFTEEEGLQDLLGFIDQYIQVASENGDRDEAALGEAFKNNLVYVGERELQEAAEGIARHLLELIKDGNEVVVFIAGQRSEKYVSLQVVQQFDKLTENEPHLRSKLTLSENSYDVVDKVRAIEPGKAKIVVCDDCAISGTKIKGFVGKMRSALVKEGFQSKTVDEMIEANLVVLPTRFTEPDKQLQAGGNPIAIFAYYGVDDYKNDEGIWHVYPGVSVTGSHSSVDYGFEQVVEKFVDYMRSKGVVADAPKLSYIYRPYSKIEGSEKIFEDPTLHTVWISLNEKYGLLSND